MARTPPILAFTPVAVVVAGCTGLEPAAVSAGATAAQSGVVILERGKARSFELARYEDVVGALRRAGDRLALRRTTDLEADGRARMVFRDERGETIVAVAERRTELVTLVQTDVGLLGAQGLGTLLINQTFAELARAGAYLDNWDRADPRAGGAGTRSP